VTGGCRRDRISARRLASSVAGFTSSLLLTLTLFATAQLCAVAGTAQNPSQGTANPNQPSGVATSRKLELHLGKGYVALKSDRYEEAVAEFRAALAADPKLDLRARFPLAVALFQLQKTTDARQEFLAVRRAAGPRPDVAYYLGRIDFLEGNAKAAIDELSQALKHPPFLDTAYYLGSAYLQDKQWAPAEKCLLTAAQLTPEDAHVQERLGALYQQTNRKAESEKALAKAADLRQKDLATSKLRIDCAQKLETGSLEEARAVCDQLFDTNDAARLTILGTLYGAHGDYAAAVAPLQRAAELNPKSPQMQYNVALVYFRLNRFEDARKVLEPMAKLWPDLVQINALLGAALYKLGDQPEAYRVLTRAHELDPQDPATANMLFESAIMLAEKGLARRDYSPAVDCLNAAVNLFPRDPEPHRLLAEAYRASNHPAEAADEQRKFELLSASSSHKTN
jgi:tetratricopeptide (TPR) repeat protein